jgi:uncharacterized protein (TIGR02569 family)
MGKKPPPYFVLNAFGANDEPVLLAGGQGIAHRSGNIVFKPTRNEEESVWIAETLIGLDCVNFRIAEPIRANNGQWVSHGWTASKYIEGHHDFTRWRDIIRTSAFFHAALKNVPRPIFLDENDDPWAVADRIAWHELPLPLDHPLIGAPLQKLDNLCVDVNLTSQIIHGDIAGNILFHDNRAPAIIDFCPYWRPAGFAASIAIADALVWHDADESLISLGNDIPMFDQLLMRAFIRRICELIEIKRQCHEDRTADIIKYLPVIDRFVNRVRS